MEEKNGSTADLKASYELQMKELRMELQNEQDKLVSVKLILQEKEKLQQSLKEDLNSLKLEHDRDTRRPAVDFMEKVKKDINPDMRIILNDGFVEVAFTCTIIGCSRVWTHPRDFVPD